ncbi:MULTISPECIES: FG-GAP-like repeat-containing protein [unclassified Streptomyces]|uniref:FG-GAP-like repeat-containing protein n=1 Tax=unclassified Streptomyces TaxID=2593676 RepID=UPI001BE8D3A8|nr:MULTISPECIES: FG-GAP-like repeat-containing protein [unclassified Streptomyces]MBT2406850.1 VCBS repeat-containing protein [Streptomyces sp. ISL-21]MBT2613539.1 VCBS repeat-containing protein [Streptomyces sp. ISL-87]
MLPGNSPAAVAATTADPVAEGSKSEEDFALEQAKATGQPYELTSARTESTDTWALPDGTWSVKRHGTPVRLLRDGAWVPTDANLAFTTSGSVAPKASTVDVAFSGGGTGPLLTGVKEGRTLSLTWPNALPTPTLAENVATYAEVLPGVDLQLKAEIEGFSQLLVVKTAEAAKNPQLASLKYKLDTVGLDVSTDAETGSVSAVNPAGQTVFTSPSPLMWDSTTASSGTAAPTARSTFSASTTSTTSTTETTAPADAFDPAPGAQDAQMPTTVTGDTLEIKPDQALLTGEQTQYPVYIDPSWAWGEKQNWTRVYKQYPTTSFWNTKDPIRVGYEAETGGSDRISRSFVQLDTSDTRYAQVKSSVFRIRNTWSWSCQDRPVQLWHTTGITKKTTWAKQPSKIGSSPLATVDDAKGWSKDCAAGNLEFDTTAKMREAASKGWANITLGLYAADETDTFGWKKFDAKSAILETTYNTPPKKPTGLGTNPRTHCTAGGLIGNTRVSLYATFDDKDGGNLTAEFELFKGAGTTPHKTMSLPANKGKVTTWVVPDADLPTGDWTWKARTRDQDNATSPWSETCKFTIDRTRPSKPPVITSADNKFPSGENGWPEVTGKAREQGLFAFAPNGVTDVDHYVWWTDYDPNPNDAEPGVKPPVRPPGYGPHFVYAYSVDKVGNRSDAATYLYYAGRSVLRDGPTDLNGDTNADIWNVDSNGTLLTYAGQGNGDFAAATNGGRFFNGDVESRGDWQQDGYNDLVALEYDSAESRKRLWAFRNNGSGVIGEDATELTVTCPKNDPEIGCEGDEKWTGDDHWYNAEQIIAAGDLNGDSQPDLLVKQGTFLWAYYGNRATYDLDLGNTRAPVLVGTGDWDKFTVIAPGDVNGDNVPDLWMREDATGDIWRSYGKKGANGYLDPTTWGNSAARVKIAQGYQAYAYPAIGSVGDVNRDGLADLWARKTDNTMLGWYGKVPGTDNKSFGSVFVIDGITGGSRIPAGTTLTGGQSLASRSATLTMQTDGNLVVTSKAGQPLWSSKTAGNAGAKAVMRTDGNLVVYKADGVTVAWETKTHAPEGYAILQDRGDLVVFNVKSQSQWSSGSSIRHDYNADGCSDMADWYDYADGHDAIHDFTTNSDGTFQAPKTGWTVAAGTWTASAMKRVTGDYNGDGIGDVAGIYGYSDGSVAFYTWTGKGDGTFNAPFKSWNVVPGQWTFGRMTPYSGDFNGDGRDDIAVWYDYADKHDTIWTFTSSVKGGFNSPTSYWTAVNSWEQSRAKTVTGDFNGDGRDDLVSFYGYADGSEKMWTFSATADGKFVPAASWNSTTWGDWARTSFHAGDFNGDGRDDVAAWYDYVDGHDGIIVFPSSTTGTFSASYTAWTVGPDNWWRENVKPVTGDFNGDGRDDFGAFYGYDDGSVKMFTFTAKTDGKLNNPVAGWSTTPGNWTRERALFLEQQN